MKIRWLLGASISLRAVHARMAIVNPVAARRVVQNIHSSTARLGDFPASGRHGTVAGTRELVVPNLPYIVVYRTTETELQILRVFHTSTHWQAGMH